MNTEAVKVKAEVMWAFLNKPNEMSGKFQVDLCNLSDKAVGALEEMGIEVKTKEGKGAYVTCKSTRPIAAYVDGGSLLEGEILGTAQRQRLLSRLTSGHSKARRVLAHHCVRWLSLS